MSRPRSNELARSGHTPLGEHGRRNSIDLPDASQQAGMGPVPRENSPGHRPERDQDKPTAPPAGRAASAAQDSASTEPSAAGRGSPATVEHQLRLGTGFGAEERTDVVDRLAALDSRLARYPAEAVDLELSVKDREGRDQRVTLECWIANHPRLVATSGVRELLAALMEVRTDLRRQLDDAATRREPMNNRQLRQRAANAASSTESPATPDAGAS